MFLVVFISALYMNDSCRISEVVALVKLYRWWATDPLFVYYLG